MFPSLYRYRLYRQSLHSKSLLHVQVTALGQPSLLERVSASLVAIHNMFKTFDADLDGVITRADFEKVTSASSVCYRSSSVYFVIP